MTLDEAILTVDELKPNQIDRARKIEWLSALDLMIYRELICTHQRGAGEAPDTFSGYGQTADPDTVLLTPPPYDEIYRFYLEMHMDLVNREFDQYNNSAALYTAAWERLSRMWHREHTPISTEGAHLRF